MIGYLKGQLIDKDEKTLLVLANGVGYRVSVTTEIAAISRLKEEIDLYIHTAVREDNISLYGFSDKEEMLFFEQLLSVSGVGPKVALDVLATPMHLTQSAIFSEDAAFLTKIKGLGKKTAERIILELKNKISMPTNNSGTASTCTNEDAISALEGLGYERSTVLKVMAKLPSEVKETEEIVKYFLKSAS